MNCKPGDLAFYKGRHAEALGRIVRCMELTPPKRTFGEPMSGPWWRIEPPIIVKGIACYRCADAVLRPIRDPDDDAQDETLSWLPVPTVEGVPA